MIFFFHFFSIGLLLRTLFYPWRRILFVKTAPGFDIRNWIEIKIANIFSRFLGLFSRILIIILGVFAEIVCLVFGILILIFFIFLPVILVYLFILNIKIGIIIFFFVLIILAGLFFEFYLKENPYILYPFLVSPSIFKKKGIVTIFRKRELEREEGFISEENVLKNIVSNFKNGLGDVFDYYSCKIINSAFSQNPKDQGIFLSTHLLQEEIIKKILLRLGINKNEFEDVIFSTIRFPASLVKILENGIKLKEGKEKLGLPDLFYSLYLSNRKLREDFEKKGISSDDVKKVTEWISEKEKLIRKRSEFWQLENLLRIPGLAKDWAYGYTVNLDKYCRDLTKEVKLNPIDLYTFAHKKELFHIEEILSRRGENNVILIGEEGVGKRTTIMGLAQMICEGRVLAPLEYKRILDLNIEVLFSGVSSGSQLRERVIKIFTEAESAGNIIMVIDNFGKAITEKMFEVSFMDIILPYLESKRFQLIGLTDYKNFHRYIEKNGMLMKLFEKVEIKEPEISETESILLEIVPFFERRMGVLVSFPAIKEIVRNSERYLPQIPFPEKAIDILDEILIYIKNRKPSVKIISIPDVDEFFSHKTGIPIGVIKPEEGKQLINLEEEIHKKIVDQDEAVKVVCNALRRARVGLSEKNKPIGVFLFLGPTGVGKTSLARALAEIYFGKEERMIRLDMTQFRTDDSISKLIGDFETEKPGILTSMVLEKSYTLILLDEIEKSAPQILNLFLEMFDEGVIRDVFGKPVSFRNTIIIGTSNAGAEMIREAILKGENLDKLKPYILDYLQKNGIFRPEFLNRFDAIVLFRPLNFESLLEIVQMELDKLNSRLKKEHNLVLKITLELKQKIAQLGYDPSYGARPIKRVIQDKIESLIAKKILKGEFKDKKEVTIDPYEIS